MHAILKFGIGAFALFGGLSLLSLLLNMSAVAQEPASEQFLIFAASTSRPLVIATLCAVSFWLGIKRFGSPAAPTNLLVVGLLCACAIFAGLVLLALLPSSLPGPMYFALQVTLAFVVCFVAASKVSGRPG